MSNLEKDVESLLKFAKVAEFKYRLFTKEGSEGVATPPPMPEVARPQDRTTVAKAVDANPVVLTIKPVENVQAPVVTSKKSLAEKFALLANQPARTEDKPILKKDSFSKRPLPTKQSTTDAASVDKPLIAVFARLDGDQSSAKKRLYLTK